MRFAPMLLSAFVLGAFSVSGVALVAVTHQALDGRIADNQRQAMLGKLAAILPAGGFDNDPLADVVAVSARDLLGAASTQVYRVRQGERPVALIFNAVVPNGYAGPIKLLVSVLDDGRLGGVRVVSHHETPGLGDKIEEQKSDWILAFAGRSLSDPSPERWGVRRDGGDFDQFTGATVTPRAIVRAVRDTLVYVDAHGQELFQPVTETAAARAETGE